MANVTRLQAILRCFCFEMCTVNFNFDCEDVTVLQAKNWSYMSGTNSIAAIGCKGWWQILPVKFLRITGQKWDVHVGK